MGDMMMSEDEIWKRVQKMRRALVEREDEFLPESAIDVFKVDEVSVDAAARQSFKQLAMLQQQKKDFEKQYTEERARMGERINQERATLIERAKPVWGLHKTELNKIDIMGRELNKSSMRGVKNSIEKAFFTIFKNMHSKTIVICGKDPVSGASPITVGKFGFGKRRYEKSQQIKSWYDLEEVMRRKDEVIKGLKENKMEKWAKKFEIFVAGMPDVKAMEESDIELNVLKRTQIPLYNGETVDADRIGLQGSSDPSIYLVSADGRQKVHMKLSEAGNFGAAFILLQVRDDLPKYLAMMEEKILLSKKKYTDWDEYMTKHFGREMLMSGV